MNRKNIVLLLVSCVILTVMGLGTSIIYSDYVYNPTGDLVIIHVSDTANQSWEPGMDLVPNEEVQKRASNLLKKLDDWANVQKATILHKNAFAAGCGYCDYSGWIAALLDSAGAESDSVNKGVYTTNSPSFLEAYVQSDILMPGNLDFMIAGTYDESKLPASLANVDFLYPLAMSATAEGVYLTDAQDVDSVVAIFEESGYEIINLREPLSLPEIIGKMLSDGFITRAAACAMAGLVLCFAYNILLLYRENIRSLQIHHIFGLSKKRMLIGSIVIAAIIAVLASGLFALILFNGLTYISMSDLNILFAYVTAGIILLSIGISIIGYIRISKAITNRR